MTVNTYECLLIFDSGRYSRDPSGVSGQFDRFVKEAGGEMLVSRIWEERKLAYPIRGQRKGTYWLNYFKIESDKIPALERECQLSESILRALILKVDPRIAEALVAHASGAGQVRPMSAQAETKTEVAAPAADEAAV